MVLMTCNFSIYPISFMRNTSSVKILVAIATRNGFNPVPGERRSLVLDELKHKRKLCFEDSVVGLRLSNSTRQSMDNFPTSKERKETWDFGVVWGYSLLPREIESPTSVFSLTFQKTLSTLVHLLPDSLMTCCIGVRREGWKAKGKAIASCHQT